MPIPIRIIPIDIATKGSNIASQLFIRQAHIIVIIIGTQKTTHLVNCTILELGPKPSIVLYEGTTNTATSDIAAYNARIPSGVRRFRPRSSTDRNIRYPECTGQLVDCASYGAR